MLNVEPVESYNFVVRKKPPHNTMAVATVVNCLCRLRRSLALQRVVAKHANNELLFQNKTKNREKTNNGGLITFAAFVR